jgi:hypothetical protein
VCDSLKDVSARMGVTVQRVCRVLDNHPRVAVMDAPRERILESARRLGYAADAPAGGSMNQSSPVFRVLAEDFADSALVHASAEAVHCLPDRAGLVADVGVTVDGFGRVHTGRVHAGTRTWSRWIRADSPMLMLTRMRQSSGRGPRSPIREALAGCGLSVLARLSHSAFHSR